MKKAYTPLSKILPRIIKDTEIQEGQLYVVCRTMGYRGSRKWFAGQVRKHGYSVKKGYVYPKHLSGELLKKEGQGKSPWYCRAMRYLRGTIRK